MSVWQDGRRARRARLQEIDRASTAGTREGRLLITRRRLPILGSSPKEFRLYAVFKCDSSLLGLFIGRLNRPPAPVFICQGARLHCDFATRADYKVSQQRFACRLHLRQGFGELSFNCVCGNCGG